MGELRPKLGDNRRIMAEGNYVIVFRPWKNGVEIVTVLHGARDFDALFGQRSNEPL